MSIGPAMGMEVPIKITGGDGTSLYDGVGFPGILISAKVTHATTVTGGMGIVVHPTGLAVLGDNFTTTADPVQVLGVAAANTTGSLNIGYLGVVKSARAATGEQVVLFGIGSICGVVVASGGTIGHVCTATSTAGRMQSIASTAAAGGSFLGNVLKPAGTTGGVTDTGSATRMGILVNPQVGMGTT